jgi:hypothetical protein
VGEGGLGVSVLVEEIVALKELDMGTLIRPMIFILLAMEQYN